MNSPDCQLMHIIDKTKDTLFSKLVTRVYFFILCFDFVHCKILEYIRNVIQFYNLLEEYIYHKYNEDFQRLSCQHESGSIFNIKKEAHVIPWPIQMTHYSI